MNMQRLLVLITAIVLVVLALPPLGSKVGAAPVQSDGQPLSPDDMDKLVAPIALYPDSMIAQILTSASSPYQVGQVNDWLKEHSDLEGSALQDAAMNEGFDASFVALVLFPDVIAMMDEKADWTQQIGRAFSTNRSDVFASVQRLRAQAHEVGNLETTEQQEVSVEKTKSGEEVIVIQPADPQIIYVPQYDPAVVYTQPSTVVVNDNSGAVAAGLIGFTAGVIVGVAIDDDDHWYGGWGWHGGCCYDDAWDDYYDHREDMANDWYDHREEMADRHSDNMEDRRDDREDRLDDRNDSRDDRQGDRDDNRDDRSGTRDDRQGDRGGDRDARQTDRQAGDSARQERRSTTTKSSSRGRATTSDRQSSGRASHGSGSALKYESGSRTRSASSRGRSSLSGSRGGGRGGGRSR